MASLRYSQAKAVRLSLAQAERQPRKTGNRVAFLGPTIARQRPDIARRLAAGLKEPLVVFGPMLEPTWDGLRGRTAARGARTG